MGKLGIQYVRMIDAQQVYKDALKIRDVAQAVMDACIAEHAIDPHARSKVMSGSLAGDAACLAMTIMQYEEAST